MRTDNCAPWGPLASPSSPCSRPGIALPAGAAAEPRIINGSLPTQAWPAQVSLHHGFLISPSGYCAGSLVSARWIVTAGHCVTNNTGNERPADDWNYTSEAAKSRVGSIARTSGGSAITVDQVIRHENYNDTTLEHDLALLHLASPVPEEPLRLIGSAETSLWSPGVAGDGDRLGRHRERRPNNSQLLEAKMPMLSDATCAGRSRPAGFGLHGDDDGVRRRRDHGHVPGRLGRAAA